MPIELKDTFPFTHAQAVAVLRGAEWGAEEIEFIMEGGVARLHGALTGVMRHCWGLADKTYPLNKYYRHKLGLGNPDDMASLILREFYGGITGAGTFDLALEAAYLKRHWQDQGVDPLTMERGL